jgi:hypothetical protein
MRSSGLSLAVVLISLFGPVYSQQLYVDTVKWGDGQQDVTQSPNLRNQLNESNALGETDNLVFTTIASLLQQWPNTRFRNGHTIAKGTIAVGTVLSVDKHLLISVPCLFYVLV